MKRQITSLLLSTVFILASCGGAGTSTDSDSTLETTAASAVGAAFSSSGESSSLSASLTSGLLQKLVKSARASGADTCDNGGTSPNNVVTTLNGASGTYGSDVDNVTVDTDVDFCEDSLGNPVTGDALYATFVVSDAEISCDGESTVITMAGEGIWQNDETNGYYPHIFGAFTMTNGTDSMTFDCTIALDGNENIIPEATSCTEQTTGQSATMDSSAVCAIDAN